VGEDVIREYSTVWPYKVPQGDLLNGFSYSRDLGPL